MRHPATLGAVGLCALLAVAGPRTASTDEPAAGESPAPEQLSETVTVSLHDGSVVIGRVTAEDAQRIVVVTGGGAEVRIPRAAIDRIEKHAPTATPQPLPSEPRRFTRDDPNATRLLFAPTGRSLARGEAQFADYYALFPGFAYGITDNFSLMGGVSVVPGLGLREQALYVAPRLAFTTSRTTSLSTGVLFATAGDETDRVGAGIAFGVGTFGTREASLTAGLGFGFVTSDGDFEMAKKPIVMIGGELQLSNSASLISENWLILEDFDLSEQPFGLALRLFGERLSVDVGVILVGEVLKDGFPVPWISFSYRFGHVGDRSHRRSHAERPAWRQPPAVPAVRGRR
jgi:hypothetical protein